MIISRKRQTILYVTIVLLTVYAISTFVSSDRWKVVERDDKNDFNVSSLFPQNKQVCVHPNLQLNDPEIMKHFRKVDPVKCSGEPDWVQVQNGTITINTHIKDKFKDVRCEIKFVERKKDFDVDFTKVVSINSSSSAKLEKDFFKVKCSANDDKKTYENVHAAVSFKPELYSRKMTSKSGLGLDVLMIGFDSLSHMAYMRFLPKTYKYFSETLNGFALNGYNIVGDGTPQALIPIFTGKTELELPRTLKRMKGSPYVDVFPMVWKDFKKHGYVTTFAEDCPHIGTFTYRMNGFNEQPADYFMRPFHLAANDVFSKFESLCLGAKRRSQLFLDWVKDIYMTHKNQRKFVFSFHSEVSHEDNNQVQTADEDLYNTLKSLKEGGHLDNTLLILMSDHGARFSKVRASLQGKQEERRPFFGFSFPEWFSKKYPEAFGNFKTNIFRLSTPFDLYPTFKDILNFTGSGMGNITHRGISLFKEIPKDRSCADADVDPHWCACLNWKQEDITNKNVSKASEAIVNHINSLTSPYRDMCRELKIKQITKAQSLHPSEGLLRFKKSNDEDGFRADMSDSTNVGSILYQIWLYTTPGNGLFETTVTHNLKDNTFTIKTSDISRTNKYGNAPKCIEKQHEELRKFCYCKNKKT